jgi:hypothetical protein
MWQKSKKLETSKQQNCSEKIFIICFLNHVIVILEELITIVILKKRFCKTYVLFYICLFLPYLNVPYYIPYLRC